MELPSWAVLLLVPIFALACRAFGMDRPAWWSPKWPWKLLIAVAVLGSAGLTLGWSGLSLGLAWFVYRAIPPKAIPPGSATPNNTLAYFATMLRHGLLIPAALIVAVGFHLEPLRLGAPFGVYAIVATLISAWYGALNAAAQRAGEPIGNQNIIVELAHGALAAVAIIAALGPFSWSLTPIQ